MIVMKTQIPISTTIEEDKVFNECYEIINGIMAQMMSHKCNEIMSIATGEVITYDEFRRVLGILDGLPHMGIMYNTKN